MDECHAFEICGNAIDDDCDCDVDEDAEPEDCEFVCDGAPEYPDGCANEVDDDCDGFIDCDDPDCADNELPETCGNDVDDNCNGAADFCDPECSEEEVCGDDIDQDCDGLADDVDANLCNPPDDPLGPGNECDEKCDRCAGNPVDLVTKHAFVGPHDDVRINSPQGGSFDLALTRVWDSAQADKDNDDDVLDDPRTTQWPHPRILGPGWRHSYDARLVLEGDAGAGQPVSLLFAHGGKNERLFKVTDDVFGRVPGRAIQAIRTAATWSLVDDDGTEYEFAEGGDTPTEMHPWGNLSLPPELQPFQEKAEQKHAWLRTIRPRGVTGYRIRLWHEQDADVDPTSAPPGSCTDVDQLGGCEPTRGLLVAVAAEWLSPSLTTWRRGSSIVLRYVTIPATTGTRTQYLLSRVLEGADLEEGVLEPTLLAEYSYSPAAHPWRQTLADVSSCIDRTDATGTIDVSGVSCASQPGARLHTYVNGSGAEAHLIAKAQHPAVSSAGAFILVDDEEFLWAEEDGVYRVNTHLSAGTELSAPLGAGDPNGIIAWAHNGFTLQTTFNAGLAVRRERCERCQGTSCVTLRERAPFFQTLDSGLPGKLAVGTRASISAGGDSITLREVDGEGNVTHEIEVVPTGAGLPTMTVSGVSGVEVVELSGPFAVIRRATRNYYIDAPGRLVASASYASTDIYNPNVDATPSERRFPTPAAAQALGWIALGASVTTRAVPAHAASLDGTTYFFDVDVFDADSGVAEPSAEEASNGLLNEPGEREVVWTHRSRTDATGAAVARSSRSVADLWGRTHWAFEHENTSGSIASAREHTLSKSHHTFHNNAAGTAARLRGQPKSSEAYPDATSTTGAIVEWVSCGPKAYDARSRITCRETPQSPVALRVRERTVTGPNGALRTTLLQKEGTSARLKSYQDHFPNGPVFESGPVGGNVARTSWSSNGDATSATYPVETRETDSAGTLLVRTTTTYDAYGRVQAVVVDDGTSPRRETAYTYDFEDSTVDTVTRAVSSSTFVVRDTDTDPETGDVLRVVEDDGDVVDYTYYPDGASRGRLESVRRNGIEVQSIAYDVDGRVTMVWNGDEQAASYGYAADGRLGTETLRGAPLPAGGFLNRTYLEELVQMGGTGPYYRATRVTTRSDTTVIRDLRTINDHMGRPLRQCDLIADAACISPIVAWFYDSKGDYAAGPIVVEGTARSVTLTNNNMTGRLAYVVHPGGATFYEYDALGRATLMLAYQGILPPASSLDSSKMKATEISYFGGTGEIDTIRYPSGRAVEHRYGPNHGPTFDRRGPAAIVIRVDPNGVDTGHRVAEQIVYDVDGAAMQWLWGTDTSSPQPRHTIERDMLGRVTRIRDLLDGDIKAELQYNGRDGDGDVAEIVDTGPYLSVLSAQDGASLPQTWSFSYAERDMLSAWMDVDGNVHTLTLDGETGKRVNETIDAQSFTYLYGGEAIERRDFSGSSASAVALSWSTTTGELSALDYGADGAFEVADMAYGPRGDLVGASTPGGSYSFARDERMLRWVKNHPTPDHRTEYRYGVAGELLEMHEVTSSFKRDEFIYLQGMPIGVTHTETAKPTPRTWWLSPDAMGTPRRVLERNATFRQASRLVMDAWGAGEQTDDFGDIGWTAPHPARPSLPFRLPGQIADDDLWPLVENRWRTYVPGLGSYTAPDPAHQGSAQAFSGPQTYAYASGRPLLISDPSGRSPIYPPGTPFHSERDAAFAATQFIIHAISSFIGNNSGDEYCCTIKKGECGSGRGNSDYKATYFQQGTHQIVNGRPYRSCEPPGRNSPDAVAYLHTHPTILNADGTVNGAETAAQESFSTGDIMGADMNSPNPLNAWAVTPLGNLLYHPAKSGPGFRTFSAAEVANANLQPAH